MSRQLVVVEECGGCWCSYRFRLLCRVDEPQPKEQDMPENNPLVKWPEKSRLSLVDILDRELFVWLKCPDMPCIKDGGRWIAIFNADNGNGMLFASDDEVCRIKFNPANKEPVFVVE